MRMMRSACAGHLLIVGDQDDGPPVAVKFRQQVHDLFAAARIERSGGFVRQDDQRIVDERARHGHPLLLAAGEFRRKMLSPVGQAEPVEQEARPFETLRPRHARINGGHFHVFLRRCRFEKIVALKHEAEDFPPHGGKPVAVEFRNLLASNLVGSGRRLIEAADHVHERRLARPRRAHHGDELALPYLDGDVVQRPHRRIAGPVVAADVRQFEQWGGVGHSRGVLRKPPLRRVSSSA